MLQEESKLMTSIIEVQDLVKKAADNAQEAVKKAAAQKRAPVKKPAGLAAHTASTKALPKADKRKSGEALGLMVGGVKIPTKAAKKKP